MAVFWMLVGCLGMAVMSALVKAVRPEMEPGVVVFIQACAGLVILFPLVIKDGLRAFKTHYPIRHVLRSSGGTMALFFYVTSLKQVPLIDAALLNQTAPIWAPFVAWIWYRSCPPARPWIGIIVGFVGVICVLRPGLGFLPWQLIFALLSGMAMALALIAIKSLAGLDKPQLVLFYTFLLSALVALPFVLMTWQTPSPKIMMTAIFAGVAYLTGQVGFVRALAHAPAAAIIPLYFLVVPMVALLDWLFWGVQPIWLSYVGALLIIGGNIWTLTTAK